MDRVRLALTYRALTARAPRPERVFEIGYGTGALLRRFLDDGAKVSGADPNQLLTEVDPDLATRGRLTQESVEKLHLEGARVDLVYGVHVIEHVQDVARTVQVAHDLLAPGGRLQLLTPAGDSWGLRLFGAAWWMLEDPTHVRFFTAESLARTVWAAGFEDVQVRRLWADSLSVEPASLVRRHRRAARPGGVLAGSAMMPFAAVVAPLTLAARGLAPALRPTLHLVARRATR